MSLNVISEEQAMAISIVQLGTPRKPGEGVRLGTVRRPPRGVPKERHASDDWYDAWLPELSPSAELVSEARGSETEAAWKTFVRRYRAEMKRPEAAHLLQALAVLSKTSDFAVGCYCEDEAHCHRSVLRELLEEHGAEMK
jgi:uncharacterized protein YeaO (DUF488 family)